MSTVGLQMFKFKGHSEAMKDCESNFQRAISWAVVASDLRSYALKDPVSYKCRSICCGRCRVVLTRTFPVSANHELLKPQLVWQGCAIYRQFLVRSHALLFHDVRENMSRVRSISDLFFFRRSLDMIVLSEVLHQLGCCKKPDAMC